MEVATQEQKKVLDLAVKRCHELLKTVPWHKSYDKEIFFKQLRPISRLTYSYKPLAEEEYQRYLDRVIGIEADIRAYADSLHKAERLEKEVQELHSDVAARLTSQLDLLEELSSHLLSYDGVGAESKARYDAMLVDYKERAAELIGNKKLLSDLNKYGDHVSELVFNLDTLQNDLIELLEAELKLNTDDIMQRIHDSGIRQSYAFYYKY